MFVKKNKENPNCFIIEDLAVTKNRKTLIEIMQSTMFNPSKKAIGNSQVVRVLTFDIKSGKTNQFPIRD
ncbi:hypothetical protein [Treponema peruense]|uniref:Uncharacterized protein n=1 Tax=Treponema peruense TaxID=2787628 RepID=A0A7T3RCS8_9SPIR|nr:hypothetical protein [Treponema peruense]QQA00666.1 hypothetical protein IWA51_10450 [Treponema peruense]